MLCLRPIAPCLAVVLSLACAGEALAAEARGPFREMHAEGEGWVLTLTDGRQFKVPVSVYLSNQRLLDGLAKDTVIVVQHENGLVSDVALEAKDEPGGLRRFTMSGQFKRYREDRKELELLDGSRYPVAASLLQDRRQLRTLMFLKEKDNIVLLLVGKEVVELEKAGSGAYREPEEVRRVLERTQAGHLVKIRMHNDPKERAYIVRQVGLASITVSPEIPGSPGKFEGTMELERAKIAAIDNPQVAAAGPQEGPGALGEHADAFARASVRVGDTIGIGFETGQLAELDDEGYALRVWRNGVWDDTPMTGKRVDVKEVRTDVWLASTESIPLSVDGEEGTLEVRARRSCARRRGSLRFQVELIHDLPKLILVDLKLVFHLGGMALAPGGSAALTEEKAVNVPLFSEQPVQIEHEVADEGLLDGWVEVAVFPRNKVQITEEAARRHLIRALTSTTRLDALAALYRIAGKNGDPMILRYLLTRAALEKDADHRVHLLKGLAASGEQASRIAVEELAGLDRHLKIVVANPQNPEQLLETGLPADMRAIPFKLALIELLGSDELGPALAGPAGGRLFDIYLEREDLVEAALKTFRRRPSEAVAALLDIATNLPVRAAPAVRLRAERAAALLGQLGRSLYEPLLLEMERQEIDVKPFRAAIAENRLPPNEVIAKAVAEVIGESYRRRRARLDRQTEVARAQHEGREYEQALATVRAVLDEESSHAGAKELLPLVLVDLGSARARGGARGEAALCYEEALPLLQGGQKARAALPLAQLIVQGCEEEIEAVAVRAGPHTGAIRLRPAEPNERLADAVESARGWLEFTDKSGTTAFVRKVCAVQKGQNWLVKEGPTSFAVLQEELERARGLSPDVQARADEVFGRLSAREGERYYEAGSYSEALHHFGEAAKYAPSDPRLKLRWRSWVQAKSGVLVGVVIALAVAGGFAAMQVFSRPKRIKFEGEFKHYGADRSNRERDLDVEQ